MSRRPNKTKMCPTPGCTRLGDFCRTFCSRHYGEFSRACIANGSLTKKMRDNNLAMLRLEHPVDVLPHWEFEGDEDTLAKMCEEQEKVREKVPQGSAKAD